jgi:hypothetical protein
MISLGLGNMFGWVESEYAFTTDSFPGGTHVEVWKKNENVRVPFMMALDLLEMGDLEFLSAFLQFLKSSTYKAYFFEAPPVTSFTVSSFLRKVFVVEFCNHMYYYHLVYVIEVARLTRSKII